MDVRREETVQISVTAARWERRSVREYESLRAGHVFTVCLTIRVSRSVSPPRQLEALRLAVDNGYYEQPRGTSIEELATQTTVARATFEEHLRKAENKLITNAGQFIRLLTETQETNRLRPASETASTTAETD